MGNLGIGDLIFMYHKFISFKAARSMNLNKYIPYYSAIKKNEIMPSAATWLDLEMIILSEISQTEKDKYHMVSLTCGTKM